VPLDGRPLHDVVLGLGEFVVRECREVGGEVELTVETRAGVVGCHGCGVRARSKGRSTVLVRDIDAFDRPVRLRWVKRRWQCIEPACAVNTWTEQTAAIGARRQLTERARAQACRRVGRDGESVAAVARDFAVGWHTIMRAVADVGAPLVDDPARTAGVSALGVDETTFLRANRRRHTRFVTGLVDLRRSRLLDIVDGRAGKAVSDWLEQRDEAWLSAVQRVALDPYRGYYNALVGGLEAPEVVVDHFHVVRLGNQVVDEVRRRVQQETLGHRGRKHDPLYRIRRLLLTGEERLTDRGRQRLRAGLAAGDPDDEVWYAHCVKEQLRAVYRAEGEADARAALAEFYDTARAADIPECDRLARTIRRWETEVLNYYRTDGLSNARCEATNALVKKVKRIGHGFRNLDNYRLRLLLHCGGITWQDQPAARLRRRRYRKRPPQLVA
jgi:transposase